MTMPRPVPPGGSGDDPGVKKAVEGLNKALGPFKKVAKGLQYATNPSSGAKGNSLAKDAKDTLDNLGDSAGDVTDKLSDKLKSAKKSVSKKLGI